MKNPVYFVLLVFVISCTLNKKTFDPVECFTKTEEITTKVKIYKPCRQFIFRAKYWDENYNLISDQQIWMMSTGEVWDYDDKQVILAIQYEFEESETDFINNFNINYQRDIEWVKSISEGFIESDSLLFFHPFRSKISIHLLKLLHFLRFVMIN